MTAVLQSHRLLAAAQAEHAALVEEARLAGVGLHSQDTFRGGPQWSSQMVAEREVTTELAVALHLSEGDARRLLHTSEGLTGVFSSTMTALRSGTISYRHAEKIVECSRTLPADCLPAYEAELLPAARNVSVQRLERLARSAVEHAQPDTAIQRHTDAAACRRLYLEPASDGMAYLSLYLPAVEAVAIYNRATELGRSAKNSGDPRTLTQLRVDTLTDLMLNAETQIPTVTPGIRARVNITVPVLALLPALPGHPTASEGCPPIPPATPTAVLATSTAAPTAPTSTPAAPRATLATPTSAPTAPRATLATPTAAATAPRATPATQTSTPTAPRATPATPPTTTASSTTADPPPDDHEIDGRFVALVAGLDTGRWAELEGYGPIDQHTALILTRDAPSLRRILTDPITGIPLAYRRERYRPPADLDELIRLTHTECTFPLDCTPSTTADLDHTIAWEDGGTTDLLNLSPLCTSHHKVKHHTTWTIEQTPTGTITWTSPAGFEYHVEPTPPTPPRPSSAVRPTPRFTTRHEVRDTTPPF
ncbi:HNH endonuclease signature motif containing protein [Subtercola boreus]|uniref:HNH endonuclease signature motif containing protein n=1 Tax=Subtercola boreus TaxID=120213 RepID=UPI001559FEEC|nr:HNH endonuclease signature motif containing protein [Subtercola boreus]